MGTHLRVLYYPMNTSMTGFRWYSKFFASFFLGESSFSIERVRASLVVEATLHHIMPYASAEIIS